MAGVVNAADVVGAGASVVPSAELTAELSAARNAAPIAMANAAANVVAAVAAVANVKAVDAGAVKAATTASHARKRRQAKAPQPWPAKSARRELRSVPNVLIAVNAPPSAMEAVARALSATAPRKPRPAAKNWRWTAAVLRTPPWAVCPAPKPLPVKVKADAAVAAVVAATVAKAAAMKARSPRAAKPPR